MDRIIRTDAGIEGDQILERDNFNGPLTATPQEVQLPPTTRVDSGVEGEQILERTIGVTVKRFVE